MLLFVPNRAVSAIEAVSVVATLKERIGVILLLSAAGMFVFPWFE